MFTHYDEEEILDIPSYKEAQIIAENFYCPCAIFNQDTGKQICYFLGILGFVSIH